MSTALVVGGTVVSASDRMVAGRMDTHTYVEILLGMS